MQNEYNLKNLWNARAEGGETLIYGWFNAGCKFSVFKKGVSTPAFSVPIPPYLAEYLAKACTALINGQPGTRLVFSTTTYDSATKTSKIEVQAAIGKDDKKCYYFEFVAPDSPTPIRFNIRSSQRVVIGGDLMSEEERSKAGLIDFRKWVEHDTELRTAARFNYEPKRSGNNNNNNGRGNYQRNQQRSNQGSETDLDDTDSFF